MKSDTFIIQQSITRPANTTQYTAKDVVNGSVGVPMEFVFPTPMFDKMFYILSSTLISSNAPTTTGSFKLLLFRIPPTTPIDHAVFAPSYSEMASCLGIVDFATAVKISTGTIYVPSGFVPIFGTCLDKLDTIYGVLIDDVGYTPASGENFRVVIAGKIEL